MNYATCVRRTRAENSYELKQKMKSKSETGNNGLMRTTMHFLFFFFCSRCARLRASSLKCNPIRGEAFSNGFVWKSKFEVKTEGKNLLKFPSRASVATGRVASAQWIRAQAFSPKMNSHRVTRATEPEPVWNCTTTHNLVYTKIIYLIKNIHVLAVRLATRLRYNFIIFCKHFIRMSMSWRNAHIAHGRVWDIERISWHTENEDASRHTGDNAAT